MKTGAALTPQTVDNALTASFTGLTAGATYEFSVAATGPAGSGTASTSQLAVSPATLDVVPDAPENFNAVALGDTSAKLTWGLPPGNPKVDSYAIQAVPVNATG